MDDLSQVPTDQLLAAYKGQDNSLADVPTDQLLAAYHDPDGSTWRKAARRVITNIPGVGAYADEAGAAYRHYVGGQDYDAALASERARNEIANTADTPKLFSTPFGDVYESGLEKAAGVASGLALPELRVAEGAGMLGGAANAAATAGAYGAAQGFGDSENGLGNRLSDAATGGALGAAIGAPLGAVGGKIAQKFDPAGASAIAKQADLQSRNAAIAAAQQEGVTLPKALGGNQLFQDTSGALASLPGTGSIIKNSVQDAQNQTGRSMMRAADAYSAAGTGNTVGTVDPTSAAHSAGNELRDSLTNWMGKGSQDILSPMYDAVWSRVNPDMLHPLTATKAALQAVQKESEASATPLGNQLQGVLGDALSRPDGMTVEGIKGLRTYVRQMKDDTLLSQGGTIQPALDKAYSALTSDLGNAVKRGGGQDALDLFNTANNTAAQFAKEREGLAKIVGTSGDISGEKLVNKLTTMAGSKSTADTQGLLLAKSKASPETWNELASAVVRKMGGAQGSDVTAPGMVSGWSPAKALTSWNNMSENGKNALFGAGPLRQHMDNNAAILEKFRELGRYGNPSGTGHAAAMTELLLSTFLAPLHVMGTMGGSYAASKFLTSPAGAKSLSTYGNTLYNLATNKGSMATAKLARLNLTRVLSDETGADEKDIDARLAQFTPAQAA